MTKPTPNQQEIRRAIEILCGDSVVELRAFHKGKKRTAAGYFDAEHREQMAEDAIRLNRLDAAVYITLNPCNPQLLGRYSNRVQDYAKSTTTDRDIVKRVWLPIDIDPVRPTDTSATDEQVDSAKRVGRDVYRFLSEHGWPAPVSANSGNGVHLFYRVDLPNDDSTKNQINRFLKELARRFDSDLATIDQSVFNAARIIKLHGTIANKGDHTPTTPWRLSQITHVPQNMVAVSLEQLVALAPQSPERQSNNSRSTYQSNFDLDEFLNRLAIEHEHDIHAGRDRYKLAHCPFNPEHGKGEAAIFRAADGQLGFKCQHNSCSDKGWRDVRKLVDGDIEKHYSAASPKGPENAPIRPAHNDKPIPLPDSLEPVAEFDEHLLPESLRPLICDTADLMQCSPDFIAVGSMVSLAGVIGRKIGIRPQRHTCWTVTPNLWGMVIGRPGIMKSPALEAALNNIKRLGAKAQEVYDREKEEYEQAALIEKMRGEAAEKKARKQLAKDPHADLSAVLTVEQSDDPQLKRYLANDTSAAALGELLRQNPNGLMVYRDELVSLLKGLDREDQAEGRGFYLTAWNGDSSYTFDRIGRGLNLYVPAVCLSLLGGTQPGKLSEYIRHAVNGGTADDGLIQRFGLMVWPDNGSWKDVDRLPDSEAKQQAAKVYDYLDTLDPIQVGAHQDQGFDGNMEGMPYLRFDDAGLDLFREWRNDLETRLRSNDLHPAVESHLAKYRKHIPALALIIHLAEGCSGPVSEQATLKALAWGDYLESHAQRVYSSISQPETSRAKKILQHISKGDLTDEFSNRDVWRRGWSQLTDSKETQQAISLLVEYGWLYEVINDDTGGRRATRYVVHSQTRSAA